MDGCSLQRSSNTSVSGFHDNGFFFVRSVLNVQSKSSAAMPIRFDIIALPDFALDRNEVFGNSAVACAQIVPVSQQA